MGMLLTCPIIICYITQWFSFFQLPSAHIYERYLYFILHQRQQTKKWEASGHAIVQLDETLFDEIEEEENQRKRYWFDFTSRKISQQVRQI